MLWQPAQFSLHHSTAHLGMPNLTLDYFLILFYFLKQKNILFNLAFQTCSREKVVFLLLLPAFDAIEGRKKRTKPKKPHTTEPKGS